LGGVDKLFIFIQKRTNLPEDQLIFIEQEFNLFDLVIYF
jgi:hypothetical protein